MFNFFKKSQNEADLEKRLVKLEQTIVMLYMWLEQNNARTDTNFRTLEGAIRQMGQAIVDRTKPIHGQSLN